jgi:hypothetical protein
MELESYVILDGQQFATKEERLIVVHSIILLHKYYKEFNMTWQLIFGV